MKKKLGILLLLCFIFFGCDDKKSDSLEVKPEPKVLENLLLQADNGEQITINQKILKEQKNFKNIAPKKENILKDLIVTSQNNNIKILFFFTTWCEPCKGILPHLDNLKNQFGEAISFYGIGVDDLVSDMENFSGIMQVFKEENSVQIPIIMDENRVELLQVLGGIEGVPLIVLYDKDGQYIIHYLGAIPEEMIEYDLAQNISKMKVK